MTAPMTTLTRSEIVRSLTRLLVEVAGVDESNITGSATIDVELRMNSVVFVELQVAIEEELNIILEPVDLIELNAFDPIVDYIFDLVKEQSP